MVAGIAVVAMGPSADPVLDPTGTGSMSNSAALLGPDARIAADPQGYIELTLEYINNPQRRRDAAALARRNANAIGSSTHVDNVYAALRELACAPVIA